MDIEQKKVNTFFREFKSIGRQEKPAIIGMVIFLFFLFAGAFIPVQDILIGTEDNVIIGLLPMSIAIASIFAVYMRISLYEVYSERINSIGSMIVLLQYHPISKKKILKFKLFHQICFLAKVTLVCLGIQLLITYIIYGMVSWVNAGYIFVFVFLVPGFIEGILMCIRHRYLYGE